MSFCTAYISIHVLSLSLIEIIILVLNRDRYFFVEFLVVWLLLDGLDNKLVLFACFFSQ
jgi:hypothetical protein